MPVAEIHPYPSIAPSELGHIPTVKIMALARQNFSAAEIAEWVERERQGYPADGGDDDKYFWESMAVEFGCRELLARYWSRLSISPSSFGD